MKIAIDQRDAITAVAHVVLMAGVKDTMIIEIVTKKGLAIEITTNEGTEMIVDISTVREAIQRKTTERGVIMITPAREVDAIESF